MTVSAPATVAGNRCARERQTPGGGGGPVPLLALLSPPLSAPRLPSALRSSSCPDLSSPPSSPLPCLPLPPMGVAAAASHLGGLDAHAVHFRRHPRARPAPLAAATAGRAGPAAGQRKGRREGGPGGAQTPALGATQPPRVREFFFYVRRGIRAVAGWLAGCRRRRRRPMPTWNLLGISLEGRAWWRALSVGLQRRRAVCRFLPRRHLHNRVKAGAGRWGDTATTNTNC